MNYNMFCSGNTDTIRIVVDNRNYVPESNEDDNEFTFTTECVPMPSGTADLVVSNVTTSVVEELLLANGERYPLKSVISYTVKNIGTDYSCNSETSLLIDNVLHAVSSTTRSR